ncbi:hypothetical protein B296_00016150 [Ensete ventricosum]|uniref:C2H2-type domain-containing protein n=1 Tax=Ensete ventricosum TaxID=4639 RepID=A0A427AI85_ENSVE|nr:hypothetical protein B296_00016150 [Ensete ventricosum]
MGGKCPSRKVKKRRFSHKTARRSKFLLKDILFAGSFAIFRSNCFFLLLLSLVCFASLTDLISDDHATMRVFFSLEVVMDCYCFWRCSRYFASEDVRDEHFRSKRHKKRYARTLILAPPSGACSKDFIF